MKIRNGAVFVALVSGLSMAAPGQDTEKSVKIEDLPVAVRKTVMEQSKGVKIRGLSQEVKQGKTYYEAELTVNGHKKDVLMDTSGAVVEIEEEVALNSLPPAVRTGIEKQDRKSTRLNSSHGYISYAVFCLKKKKKTDI